MKSAIKRLFAIAAFAMPLCAFSVAFDIGDNKFNGLTATIDVTDNQGGVDVWCGEIQIAYHGPVGVPHDPPYWEEEGEPDANGSIEVVIHNWQPNPFVQQSDWENLAYWLPEAITLHIPQGDTVSSRTFTRSQFISRYGNRLKALIASKWIAPYEKKDEREIVANCLGNGRLGHFYEAKTCRCKFCGHFRGHKLVEAGDGMCQVCDLNIGYAEKPRLEKCGGHGEDESKHDGWHATATFEGGAIEEAAWPPYSSGYLAFCVCQCGEKKLNHQYKGKDNYGDIKAGNTAGQEEESVHTCFYWCERRGCGGWKAEVFGHEVDPDYEFTLTPCKFDAAQNDDVPCDADDEDVNKEYHLSGGRCKRCGKNYHTKVFHNPPEDDPCECPCGVKLHQWGKSCEFIAYCDVCQQSFPKDENGVVDYSGGEVKHSFGIDEGDNTSHRCKGCPDGRQAYSKHTYQPDSEADSDGYVTCVEKQGDKYQKGCGHKKKLPERCNHDSAYGSCGKWRCVECNVSLPDGPQEHGYYDPSTKSGVSVTRYNVDGKRNCAVCSKSYKGANCGTVIDKDKNLKWNGTPIKDEHLHTEWRIDEQWSDDGTSLEWKSQHHICWCGEYLNDHTNDETIPPTVVQWTDESGTADEYVHQLQYICNGKDADGVPNFDNCGECFRKVAEYHNFVEDEDDYVCSDSADGTKRGCGYRKPKNPDCEHPLVYGSCGSWKCGECEKVFGESDGAPMEHGGVFTDESYTPPKQAVSDVEPLKDDSGNLVYCAVCSHSFMGAKCGTTIVTEGKKTVVKRTNPYRVGNYLAHNGWKPVTKKTETPDYGTIDESDTHTCQCNSIVRRHNEGIVSAIQKITNGTADTEKHDFSFKCNKKDDEGNPLHDNCDFDFKIGTESHVWVNKELENGNFYTSVTETSEDGHETVLCKVNQECQRKDGYGVVVGCGLVNLNDAAHDYKNQDPALQIEEGGEGRDEKHRLVKKCDHDGKGCGHEKEELVEHAPQAHSNITDTAHSFWVACDNEELKDVLGNCGQELFRVDDEPHIEGSKATREYEPVDNLFHKVWNKCAYHENKNGCDLDCGRRYEVMEPQYHDGYDDGGNAKAVADFYYYARPESHEGTTGYHERKNICQKCSLNSDGQYVYSVGTEPCNYNWVGGIRLVNDKNDADRFVCYYCQYNKGVEENKYHNEVYGKYQGHRWVSLDDEKHYCSQVGSYNHLYLAHEWREDDENICAVCNWNKQEHDYERPEGDYYAECQDGCGCYIRSSGSGTDSNCRYHSWDGNTFSCACVSCLSGNPDDCYCKTFIKIVDESISPWQYMNRWAGLAVIKSLDGSDPVYEVNEGGLFNAFNGCGNLGMVNMCYVTNVAASAFYNTFKNCVGLTNVNFSALEKVGSLSFAGSFGGCESLETISLPKLNESDYGATNAFREAFIDCTGLKEVRLGEQSEMFKTSGLYYNSSFNQWLTPFISMFQGCTSLTNVVIGWKNLQDASLHGMFYDVGTEAKVTVDCSSITNAGKYAFALAFADPCVKKVDLSNLVHVGNYAAFIYAFYGSSITECDLSKLETVQYGDSGSQAASVFTSCFSDCHSLTNVDMRSLRTRGGNYGSTDMFKNCDRLECIRLDNIPALGLTSTRISSLPSIKEVHYDNVQGVVPSTMIPVSSTNDWIVVVADSQLSAYKSAYPNQSEHFISKTQFESGQ